MKNRLGKTFWIWIIFILSACNSPPQATPISPTETVPTAEATVTDTPLTPTTAPIIPTPAPTETAVPLPTETISETPEPTPLPWNIENETTFAKTVGGGQQDRGIDVIQTSDGGYVFVGYTSSLEAVREDVYLVRTDARGEEIWSKRYGGDGIDNGWAVVETADNGFIIAGFTDSFGAGGMDFYLLRIDPNGELLWEQTYGGPEDEYAWAIAPTTDGGYVLAGETTSFGEGQEDGYIVKVTAEGDEVWSQTFGGPAEDRVFSVTPGSDSGYVMTGTTTSFASGQRDMYLVKVDESGTLAWSQVYGEELDDVGHTVEQTADNGYIVIGYTRSFEAVNYDSWLLKTDANGDMEWQTFFGDSGDDRTIGGQQTADGGYILTGFTRGFGARGWDVFLMKTDSAGEVLWHKTFGGSADDTGYTVAETADNGFVLTGETYSFGEGGDLYLIKVNQDGEFFG